MGKATSVSIRSDDAHSVRAAIDHSRDWPLVGRDAELQVGRQVLERPGSSLVLGGSPGVGKSRLARELAEAVAAALDAVVVRVIASAALSDVPGAALAPLVRLGASAARSDGDGTAPPEDTSALLARVHSSIESAAADQPLVVLVDDAHLLDVVSAAALRQLVVSESARVVATVRTGERIPADVAALALGERGDRLEVMTLSPSDVGTLLAAVLGSTPAPETTRALSDRSGGNCLALRALVLDGIAAGRFTSTHGVVRWELTGSLGQRLIDLVDSWLGTLDADESTALLTVTLGAPVPAHVPLTPPVDARALDQLEARGAVVTDENGTVRLGHQLYGDASRARARSSEIAAARQALIASFLGAMRTELATYAPGQPGVLLRDLDAATDLLRVAGWLLEDDAARRSDVVASDEDRRALFAAAADVAARLGAIDAAATIAAAAVASGAFASLAVLAEAQVRLGRTDDAAAAIDQLWRALDRPPATLVRRAVQTELTIHLLHRHDRAAAAAAVAAALERVTDAEDEAFIRATYASFLAMIGDLDAADDALGDLGDELPEVRLRAVPGRVAILVAAGRIEAAVATADAAVAEALTIQGEAPEAIRWSVSALANALLTGGYLDRLWQLVEIGRSFETVDSEAAAFRGLMEGRALLFAGRGQDARAVLSDAADWYTTRNQRMRVRWLLSLLAEASLLTGDHAAAVTIARQARGADRADNLADHDADRALAWVDACTGGTVPSAAGSLAAADVAARAHARPFELLALWDAFRLTASKPARRRIVALAPSIESPLARLIGAAAEARTSAQLDAAAADFADAGFAQWAAETGRRAERSYREEGRRSLAAQAGARADAWWQTCGRPWSPVLTTVRGDGGDLTPREAEVARLAARGETSRAIAAQLGISVRTVDNLLGKVYLKLGIAGRAALGDAIDAQLTH